MRLNLAQLILFVSSLISLAAEGQTSAVNCQIRTYQRVANDYGMMVPKQSGETEEMNTKDFKTCADQALQRLNLQEAGADVSFDFLLPNGAAVTGSLSGPKQVKLYQ